MARIKRFLRDETATAEAAGWTVMIAAAGLLLAVGVSVWFNALSDVFSSFAAKIQAWTNAILP